MQYILKLQISQWNSTLFGLAWFPVDLENALWRPVCVFVFVTGVIDSENCMNGQWNVIYWRNMRKLDHYQHPPGAPFTNMA